MQPRRNKDATQEFTTITTSKGTYELWNSLTTEQENLVLEQLSLEEGGLPVSKKDLQRQRLLFGQGAFGKVRLARKDGKFLAVKKLAVNSDEERKALLKEYDFGHILKAANIPHVAYGTDGIISTDAQGHERLYLFMENIAALGDGDNLKRLISYLPSSEKRSAVLKHAAYSILETAAKMQELQIYHRDIKASNLLVSATGEIYLSDFGAAMTSNSELIAAALNQNSNEYSVSMVSDRRYFPPEFHIAITLNQSLPSTSTPSDALHDNWRLGLTLLQLCGVVKEGQGLLSQPYNTTDEFGNMKLGWIEKLKQNRSGKSLTTLIIDHLKMELKKIRLESLHKIPIELQPVIFGLLEMDPEKRLNAAEALNFLSPVSESEKQDISEGFKIIVHNQIAVSVKNKIKKALKTAAKESPNGQQWLDIALKEFKNLIQQPNITPQNIQDLINFWILDDKNRPDLTYKHLQAMLEREKQKPKRHQDEEILPKPRRNKGATQEFTMITTPKGTYELWNSLTTEQENLVLEQLSLEKGGLPISKKDAQRQRLLFGQGAFGKVRLARKDSKFLAVKKLDVNSDEEEEALLKEYDFGRVLKATNIPHVAYGTDGVISTDAHGQKRFYLFMDSVAALGDGTNLKRLISYLPSSAQREAVLNHAARSLLEAVSQMHEHQIYHRDIKASNLLVSATGELFLSDFGSASTSNTDLIANVLNQNTDYYAVSMVSDRRYFTPELHKFILLKHPLPNTLTPSEALHDNWRLGLTLLQLCGVLKEGNGLLRLANNSVDEFDKVLPGWLEDLKQNRTGKPFAVVITEYFQKEIEKIKIESLDKIPTALQPVIFGLLDIDPGRRLTAAQALNLLPSSSDFEKRKVADGFKVIVHNQVAESVKSKIKKVLKEVAKGSRDGHQWIEKALNDFKYLIQHPDTTPQNIQNFINAWILDENKRPSLTFEHYETMLDRVKKKANQRQDRVLFEPINDTLPEASEARAHSEVTYRQQNELYEMTESMPIGIADNHSSPLTSLTKEDDTLHHDIYPENKEELLPTSHDLKDPHYAPLTPLIAKDDTLHHNINSEDKEEILPPVYPDSRDPHYTPLTPFITEDDTLHHDIYPEDKEEILPPVYPDSRDPHYTPLTPFITENDTLHHDIYSENKEGILPSAYLDSRDPHYDSSNPLNTENNRYFRNGVTDNAVLPHEHIDFTNVHESPLQVSTGDILDSISQSKNSAASSIKNNDTSPDFLQKVAEDGHAEKVLQHPTKYEELNRLEKVFTGAADDLVTYCRSSLHSHDSYHEISSIIDGMKNGIKSIKELIFSKPDNNTRVEQSTERLLDKSALKAAMIRIEQIVSQLSLGKIMQLDEQSILSVAQMLTKDKQFLESIAGKIRKRDKIDELLNQISEKLQFIDQVRQNGHFLISTNQLNALPSLENKSKATTYIANNDETNTQFRFTKSKNTTVYELPTKFTDDVRNFVANRTIRDLNKAQKIYIYASREEIGKAIAQTILQGNSNKQFKIYVNDQLISIKNQHSRGKLFGFFGEKVKPTVAKQHEKFTVKEMSSQESTLRK